LADTTNHINLLLDTNALTNLHRAFDGENRRFAKFLLAHKSLHFFVSYLTLVEQFKDAITWDQVAERQQRLSLFYAAIGSRGILAYPDLHLKRRFGLTNRDESKRAAKLLDNRLQQFLDLCCFAEYETAFGPESQYIKGSASDIGKNMDRSLSVLRKSAVKSDRNNLKRGLASANRRQWYAEFGGEALKRFSIVRTHPLPPGSLEQDFPSLCYLIDLYRVLDYKAILPPNPMSWESSMLIDMDQIVYMDVMDYLITDDSPLTSLVNDSGNPELVGRCLSFDSVFGDGATASLRKRASWTAGCFNYG